MSKHMDLVRATVGTDGVRACGEAMGLAVAVTGDELVTARAGFFRRGDKVERRPLGGMTSMRVLPNPRACLLEVNFGGAAALRMMFEPQAREHFERIVVLLREILRHNGGADLPSEEPVRQEGGR